MVLMPCMSRLELFGYDTGASVPGITLNCLNDLVGDFDRMATGGSANTRPLASSDAVGEFFQFLQDGVARLDVDVRGAGTLSG